MNGDAGTNYPHQNGCKKREMFVLFQFMSDLYMQLVTDRSSLEATRVNDDQ